MAELILSVDTESLSSDGSSLNISGMNLESTLGNVNSVVKAIESGAFTGTAADEELVN